LWLSSDLDSDAETFGATCGGRTDGTDPGVCEQTDGGAKPLPSTFGDDPTLDGLWTKCQGGDGGACDELFAESPSGSDYENFGLTCGNRTDGEQDSCVGAF
jgi:hypothetical protein